jgi:hypothetical protein
MPLIRERRRHMPQKILLVGLVLIHMTGSMDSNWPLIASATKNKAKETGKKAQDASQTVKKARQVYSILTP